jgi:hypothetical protein
MTTETAQWLKAMHDCLAAAEQEQMGSACPVVDHELITAPGEGLEGMEVWCICRTKDEKNTFTDMELTRYTSSLRRRMLQAGFPESAVASLTIRVTSREDVAVGRGR